MNAAFDWLFDPDHWSGPTGFPTRILEHLGYAGLTVLIAAAIAVPLGAAIGHTGRGTFLVAGLSNGLRALPELGLLTFLVLLTYVGLMPVVISLVILALPPILAGTYAGIRNVDPAIVDAAKGMGMRWLGRAAAGRAAQRVAVDHRRHPFGHPAGDRHGHDRRVRVARRSRPVRHRRQQRR